MSNPIILESPVYHINLTILLSVLGVALTAMGTIVAIFRKKPKEDATPGKNPFCLQNKSDLTKLEDSVKETDVKVEKNKEDNIKKIELLRELLNKTSIEVVRLTTQADNTTKNIDETKQAVKEVTAKLDDLLKQLLEWMAE